MLTKWEKGSHDNDGYDLIYYSKPSIKHKKGIEEICSKCRCYVNVIYELGTGGMSQLKGKIIGTIYDTIALFLQAEDNNRSWKRIPLSV